MKRVKDASASEAKKVKLPTRSVHVIISKICQKKGYLANLA